MNIYHLVRKSARLYYTTQPNFPDKFITLFSIFPNVNVLQKCHAH